MGDREIVAAIAAGEFGGLADAYDRYAPSVHAYCRSMLRDPADAAEAAQDTFVIAAGRLYLLRETSRLRPWLYGVARNECRRRLRAGAPSAIPAEPGEVTFGGPRQSPEAEWAELRALVSAALAGLNPGDREIIELNLRHGLDGDDLASVLGESRAAAHIRAVRARTEFGAWLGALLAARDGWGLCRDLDAILAGWDGELTVTVRKRLNRHVATCRACCERRRREPGPVAMLGFLPLVLLPPDLRERVFWLAAEPSSVVARYRARVVRRAGRFTRSGFLRPAGARGGQGMWDQVLPTAGAAAFAAVLGIGAIVALALLHHHPESPVSALIIPRSPAPSSSAPPATGPSASPSVAAAKPADAPGVHPKPAPSRPHHAPPGPSTRHSPSPSPSQSPSPSPSRSPSPTPSQGVPVPSPATVVLAQPASGGPYTGTFTVTAQGGPANFTIDDPAPPGDLGITPSAGSLQDGEQVTVTVTVLSDAGLGPDTILTLTPGGATVDVQYPPAGGGAQLASARSWAAARVIAHSFPNATSRGRYFMPQSGASTSRSART